MGACCCGSSEEKARADKQEPLLVESYQASRTRLKAQSDAAKMRPSGKQDVKQERRKSQAGKKQSSATLLQQAFDLYEDELGMDEAGIKTSVETPGGETFDLGMLRPTTTIREVKHLVSQRSELVCQRI